MSIQLSNRASGTGWFTQRTFRREIRTAIWCLSCLLVISLLLPQGSAKDKDPDKFRPFKLKTLDGTPKTLQDFANKATLVSFFFPKCEYCKIALPEVQKI